MNLNDILIGLSALIFVLLPCISTIIVGINLATIFGFTGVTWWCFLHLFVMICIGLISLSTNKG